MAKKKKFYVVWLGHRPGVYTDWYTAKQQIDGYKGAKYKSFPDRRQAEAAFAGGFEPYLKKAMQPKTQHLRSAAKNTSSSRTGTFVRKSISVDAACAGNPGKMEYQGVMTVSKRQLFHRSFPLGTNNIGEFLALVHALAFLKKQNLPDLPIYSDSRIAIGWVYKKKCKTTLGKSSKTQELWEMIERAEEWLQSNTITNPILKWETRIWGEIPADFGRK